MGARIEYWAAYGGWKAFWTSKYSRWAFAVTALAFPMWLFPGWWEIVISVSPSLLGFSLAAFALTMGLGSENFRIALGGSNDNRASPLIQVSATFTHFIVMQCMALGYAILARVFYFEAPAWVVDVLPWVRQLPQFAWVAWLPGVWLFVYSLLLTIAAAKGLFWYMGWFDKYAAKLNPGDEKASRQLPPRGTHVRGNVPEK